MSSITPFPSSPLSFQTNQGLRQNTSPRSLLHAEDPNQKKRLFVRKPCASPSFILADKKRKQPLRQEFTNEASVGSFRSTREKELAKENREYSQNDESFLCVEKSQDKQVSWRQQMFFKPSLSQNQLLSGLKYIQRKSFRTAKQEAGDNAPNDNKNQMDQTTDHSGQSLLQGCKSINTIRCKPSNLQNTENSDIQKFDGIPTLPNQNLNSKWCVNCRNNKQKCEILTERCAKLEEQLQLKNKYIKEVSEKIEQLRVEKAQKDKDLRQLLQNDEELRQIIENLQRRAVQSEQEFVCTFEGAKKELQRLNEKIKYSEMENTMLLRYKEEYCMMVKECDKYRHENDGLKRQLNNIARMDSNFNFSKHKQKYQKPAISQTDRHKLSKPHIPQNKEEDAISLDLSQWSVQQHD